MTRARAETGNLMTVRDSDAVLEVENVSVRFGGLLAVDKASLSVRRGQLIGLIGPNGAGKTTLFNVIAGIQPATSGVVRLSGRDISRLPPHRRARLGIGRTFQRLEVFGTLTVRENVLVAAEARRRWDRTVNPAQVTEDLLRRLNLDQVHAVVVDTLPTGTQRLVELARALAGAPRLLLLDEVASGLSAFEAETMAGLLRELAAGGLSVLLVEHDMPFIMGLCERVSMLDHGVIVVTGTPADVQANPDVKAAYLGSREAVA
jgi:branched-chain amino acid transport system ATP-binding protein